MRYLLQRRETMCWRTMILPFISSFLLFAFIQGYASKLRVTEITYNSL